MPLGDADQQTIGQLRIEPAQRQPADDLPFGQPRQKRRGLPLHPQHELVEGRPPEPQPGPGQLAQPLPGVGRLAQVQQGHLAQSLRPQAHQVDGGHQGDQRLGGADVGGGLLPPDVLLARGQREDVAGPPLPVHRLPHESPGHVSDVLLPGGEEAQGRPPVLESDAQRLPLAGHEVGPALAGGLQESQRHGLGHDREKERPRRVGRLGQRDQILDPAEEVRGLHHHAGGPVPERLPQRHRIRQPGLGEADLAEEQADLRRIGPGRLPVLGVDGAGHHDLGAAGDPLGHQDGLGRGGGPLVHGGVAHLHARELADECLVLEEGL